MKNLIFVTLLVFTCCLNTQAQTGWVMQNANVRGDLVAVFFTSSDRGFIAGDNGYLASTVDGGKSWEKYPLNTTEDINEIYFRNDDNGYLVAGRKMFITRDAGRTWQDIRIYRTGEFGSGTPEFLSIRFSDKKHGYVIGSVLRRVKSDDVVVDSLMMRTEDGGETWQRMTLPTKKELFHLDFNGNSHGWVVGDNGIILASTDDGRTWAKQTSGTSIPLYNVDFRDDKEGYVVGKIGTILRTENGGLTWDKVATNFTDTLMRVDFADDKNGWIVGYAGDILRSNDKGKTWIRQESTTTQRLYGLYMDKKYGWAVGANGVILRYKK
ncbi:MAG: YCF48-related protein [Pyrinomonadaceae bacterium]